MGTRRNIFLSLIFTFVTCGLYGLYWHVKITDEINSIVGDSRATSGIMTLIFTIITCGLYGIYWAYTIGEKVDRIKGNLGGNSNILYLVLFLFGLGIIDYLLIQDTINKKVDGII